jgi:hypothetical protein
MSGSWAAGWAVNDIVTAAEFKKGVGMVADSTLGAAAASIDFTGLPTTYAHLMVFLHARGDTAATWMLASLRFNNDSGANYYQQRINGTAAAVSASESLAQTALPVGDIPAGSAPAGIGGSCVVFIPGYSTGSFSKGVSSVNAAPAGTATGTLATEVRSGFWNSGANINRITLTASAGNFAIGTRATVYAFGA